MARRRAKKQQKNDVKHPEAPADSGGAGDRVRRLYLIVTAFCAGASVMIIELAGNRILAPWCGNSLYTWTGLIGVILISISCGYYLGGYLADRRGDYTMLAHLLGLSAFLTVLIPAVAAALDDAFVARLGVIWGPVVATTFLFALPGCLLATVSPFAIRLISLLSQDKHIGVSAGSIGMSATLGSVVGTFATGFLLVPHMRLKTIFLVTGLLLAVLSVAGYLLLAPGFRQRKFTVLFTAAILVVLMVLGYSAAEESPPGVVFERNTFYHRIRVVQTPTTDGDRLRTLYLDTTEEGSQFEKSREMSSIYQRYWELARVFCGDLKKAAFLGGGAFTMPQAVLDAFPEAEADVVEIDPAVIDVGREYFRLNEYPRLNAVADDARHFLATAGTQYDLIFADAYRGRGCMPAHLVTREFFSLAKSRLTDRGVLIVNVVSSVRGDQSMLFRSVARTIGEVFEFQAAFATHPHEPEVSWNVFIVAASHDLEVESISADRFDNPERIEYLLSGYVAPDTYDSSEGVIFTDDHNPVEYLVAKTLSTD